MSQIVAVTYVMLSTTLTFFPALARYVVDLDFRGFFTVLSGIDYFMGCIRRDVSRMSQVKRIADYLIKHGLTVATAESCTGGMVAAGFTDLPGISACFGCGVVTYSNEAKEKLLGVSHETLVTYGAVSAETAAEMAEGLEKLSGADFAVSITGIAGPAVEARRNRWDSFILA